MKLNYKNVLSDFVRPIDLLNTINGGVSMTTMDLSEEDNGFILHISAPTVHAEAFNIYVDGNKLIIFSELSEELNDMNNAYNVHIPMFHHTFEVPSFINIDQIEAVYEDGVLKVFLPFKDQSKIQRRIDIQHL